MDEQNQIQDAQNADVDDQEDVIAEVNNSCIKCIILCKLSSSAMNVIIMTMRRKERGKICSVKTWSETTGRSLSWMFFRNLV